MTAGAAGASVLTGEVVLTAVVGAGAGSSCLALSKEGALSAAGTFVGTVSTGVDAVGCLCSDAGVEARDVGASLCVTVAEGVEAELSGAACVDGSSNVKSVSKGAAAAGLATLVCAKPVLASP